MSQRHALTAGIDLGDRYTHVCLLDSENGEVIEESRIPTNTKAFQRRFSGIAPMRIAIETGTHSPWVSRLLEEYGHEVLVFRRPAKCASSTAKGARTTRSTPRSWRGWPGLTPSCSHRSSTVGKPPRHIWHSFARAMCWWVPEPSSSTTFEEQSSRSGEGFPNARQKLFIRRSPSTCQGNSHQSPGADPGDHSLVDRAHQRLRWQVEGCS
jgi:hypothetical protein